MMGKLAKPYQRMVDKYDQVKMIPLAISDEGVGDPPRPIW